MSDDDYQESEADEFKSVFEIPRTYSGLLDDVVDRYKITPEIDETFFNRSILRNLFFSGQIYLNDGYLVNHPSSFRQIMDENSVLNSMLGKGFIQLLVRKKDPVAFAKNPEHMASRGVASFAKLVDDPDWPQIRRRLHDWAEGHYAYGRVMPWPNFQMHVGFRKLFARIFDKSLDDLGLDGIDGFNLLEFQELYESHGAYDFGPRTAAEGAAQVLVERGRILRGSVPLIMDIANQCYHYNFAMCLTQATGQPVIADTTIGLAFEDILELDQVVETEVLNTPVLAVPEKFPVNNGLIFESFLNPGSKANRAKHEFLGEMEKLFKPGSNQSARQQAKAVREASEQYRRFLIEHFQDKVGLSDWEPRKSSIITFGLGKLGGAFGADNVMLAANLASSNRASSFIHRMTRPLRERILDVAFDPNSGMQKRFRFTVGDIQPRFASLAFNREAVANHTVNIPANEV